MQIILWENVDGFPLTNLHCLEWCHIMTPVHDLHASEEPCSKGVKTTLVGETKDPKIFKSMKVLGFESGVS